MKIETMIYEKVRDIIPENSEKTIFFTYVDANSYEIFFYSYIKGKFQQCYNLAEQGIIDVNDLDKAFETIAKIIRESKVFIADKRNIATIKVDKSGIKIEMSYADKEDRLYHIKKSWINDHIFNNDNKTIYP